MCSHYSPFLEWDLASNSKIVILKNSRIELKPNQISNNQFVSILSIFANSSTSHFFLVIDLQFLTIVICFSLLHYLKHLRLVALASFMKKILSSPLSQQTHQTFDQTHRVEQFELSFACYNLFGPASHVHFYSINVLINQFYLFSYHPSYFSLRSLHVQLQICLISNKLVLTLILVLDIWIFFFSYGYSCPFK